MSPEVLNALHLTEVKSSDPAFISFMEKWESNVEKYFPNYSNEEAVFSEILLINHKGEDAGIFIYQNKGEQIHIEVDYVAPGFRDLGIGKNLLIELSNEFKKDGFKVVFSITSNEDHKNYLLGLGFKQSSKHPDRYALVL
jgi:N-acetylglutamate synthase-like GNAT family acetyltransferase